MKRTCKSCYAAETGSHPMQGEPHGCSLGYQTDGAGSPLEDCPKPKSWKLLEKASKNGRKSR